MRLVKKQTEALAGAVDEDELSEIKSSISGDNVLAWSVFDPSGLEIAGEGSSETATAVCSNVFDMVKAIGEELNETSPRPSFSFFKGTTELHSRSLRLAHMLVISEKSSGIKRGV